MLNPKCNAVCNVCVCVCYSLQGSAGVVGSILLGLFSFERGAFYHSDPDDIVFCFDGSDSCESEDGINGAQFFGYQIGATVLSAVWSAFWTFVIMMFIKHTVGVDITPEQEEVGLDLTQIGEQAYDEKVSLKQAYNQEVFFYFFFYFFLLLLLYISLAGRDRAVKGVCEVGGTTFC